MDEKKNNSVTIILMIILVCIAGYFIYENLLLSDVAKLERQAKKGDVNAQFELGKMYDHGSGVKEDKKKSLEWYLLAAKQGHGSAQNCVGVAYLLGKGVEKDEVKAVEWFKKSLENKHYHAYDNLGHMYLDGLGVLEKSYEMAFQLFEEWATVQGVPNAMFDLAYMYIEGYGCFRDYKKALEWLKKLQIEDIKLPKKKQNH